MRTSLSGLLSFTVAAWLVAAWPASCLAAGWQPVAGEGGQAEKAADFGGGVEIVGPAGWLAGSDALGDSARLLVRFRARRVSGTGPLLVGTGPEDAWPALDVPADETTRNFELVVTRPAGASVYVGATPGDRWLLGPPSTVAAPRPKIEQLWTPAKTTGPLQPDWQPYGLLDARVLTAAGRQMLKVTPGSLQIVVPPTVEVLRGLRDETKAEAINSAENDVSLTTMLEGPPWAWVPHTTVPVPPRQPFTLRPEFASFWAGETWVKLTFEASGQQASLPVRVKALPSYPAFGLFLGPQASAQELAEALTQPVSIVMAPARLWQSVGPPRLGPEGLAYGTADELIALAQDGAAGWCRIACIWGEPGAWAEQTQTLSASDAVRAAGWMLAAGPLPTRLSEEGMMADESALPAVQSCAERLACIAAVPPTLPEVAVVEAQITGVKPESVIFWRWVDRAVDAGPLRRQLTQAGAALPIIWAGLPAPAGAGTTRGPELAVWCRAAASLAYAGATAILAPPQDSGLPLWLDVMRELSAAVPLASPCETDFASTASSRPVTYKVFVRGSEGTLAVSNSSGYTLEIACEVWAAPFEANLVRFAPACEPLRTHTMPFRFPEDARKLGRQLIFLRMLPGETALLNVRLRDVSPTWLRSIEPRPVIRTTGPQRDPIPTAR
ncbi:MAG: hypothetical protein N2512_05880 [Armatimonadetes bacterium]|nr:hypothetical protein [Armatimonadota bacterium]